MRSKKRNILFLALIFLAVTGYVLCTDGPETILALCSSLNPLWVGCALLMMAAYWLLEGAILHGVVRTFHPSQRFSDSLHTSMLGQLFNCLTPFSSGGQPVQAYDMVKSGVPLGIAGSSLLIKFILYQTALTVYSAGVLLFYWRAFSSMVPDFGWLVFLGFAVNAAVMLGLFSVCFFRRLTRFLALRGIRLLSRFRIVKNREEAEASMEKELSAFHESFLAIRTHKRVMAGEFLLSFVQLTVFFLVPYFILLSFGVKEMPVGMAVSAQAFVTMVSSFVPLPGAAGGAEFSFHTFFSPLFPDSSSVNLAMLLWRLLTFYLPILAGAAFTARGRSAERLREAQ